MIRVRRATRLGNPQAVGAMQDYYLMSEYATLKFLETIPVVPAPGCTGSACAAAGPAPTAASASVSCRSWPGSRGAPGRCRWAPRSPTTPRLSARRSGSWASLPRYRHPFPKAGLLWYDPAAALAGQNPPIQVSAQASDRWVMLVRDRLTQPPNTIRPGRSNISS